MTTGDPIRQVTVQDMIHLQKILDTSGGRPIALMDGQKCLGYIVSNEFAADAGAGSEAELIAALKAAV